MIPPPNPIIVVKPYDIHHLILTPDVGETAEKAGPLRV